MTLAVGEKVLMEFSTFGDRFLCVVTEVGKDGRLYVYASLPPVVVSRLSHDRFARVRFAREGTLQGFDSRVLNRDNPPGVILELAGPDAIYNAEDRQEPRCACRFPASIGDDDAAVQAVVEDMSVSCTRVRFLNGSRDALAVGRDGRVRLTFHPFDMGDGYTVTCTVKSDFMKDGSHYAVLEFLPEEIAVRERIARFVEAQVRCGIPRL
jgi:PilZ domain.